MTDRLTVLTILEEQDMAALDTQHIICVRQDIVDDTWHGTVENAEHKLVAFVDSEASREAAMDRLMTMAGL